MTTDQMTRALHFPSTADLAQFGETGPKPQFLLDSQRLTVLVGALRPGQQIPPHPESLAVYHFLSGAGEMTVDGATYPVGPSCTVIALDGASRGMRATAELVFLASKAGALPEPTES